MYDTPPPHGGTVVYNPANSPFKPALEKHMESATTHFTKLEGFCKGPYMCGGAMQSADFHIFEMVDQHVIMCMHAAAPQPWAAGGASNNPWTACEAPRPLDCLRGAASLRLQAPSPLLLAHASRVRAIGRHGDWRGLRPGQELP